MTGGECDLNSEPVVYSLKTTRMLVVWLVVTYKVIEACIVRWSSHDCEFYNVVGLKGVANNVNLSFRSNLHQQQFNIVIVKAAQF